MPKRILTFALIAASAQVAVAQTAGTPAPATPPAPSPNSLSLTAWLDAAVRHTGTATGSNWAIGGSASAYNSLTFSGRRELPNGTYGFFLLNYRFLINTGAPNGLSNAAGADPFWRQSVVGIGKMGYGDVQLGHQIMPLQDVNSSFDPWGNATVATTHSTGIAATIRANNAVYYHSPIIGGGFSFQAAMAGRTSQFVAEHGSGVLGYNAKAAALSQEHPIGFSVRYQSGPLAAAAAYDKNGSDQKTVGLYGSYDFGVAKILGQFESGDNYTSSTSTAASPDEKIKVYAGGARVPVRALGPVTAVIGFQHVSSNLSNRNANKIGIGGEYLLDKDWMLYSNLGKWSGERVSVASRKTQFDLGVRIKF
jgi:predicted porin